MLNKNIDDRTIGIKILSSAIKMETILIDILRLETRILKKHNQEESINDDIKNMNRIIKYTLYSLTLIDDRIKLGIDLIKDANCK